MKQLPVATIGGGLAEAALLPIDAIAVADGGRAFFRSEPERCC